MGGEIRISAEENAKRKRIKKYFDRKDTIAIVLIVIGVPLLFLAFLGLIPIGIGVYMLVTNKVAADSQIDAWVEDDFRSHDFVQRAQQMAGFDELVREPILLTGPSVESGDEIFSNEIMGDDGLFRTTPMAATVILCSPEQIGVYQTGLDLTTGNRVNEYFIEVFYQDVVGIGVGTKTTSLDLDDAVKNVTSLNLEDAKRGIKRSKMLRNLRKLKERFAKQLIAGVLQRDRARIYQIEFIDNEKIRIPVRDGRPTRVANMEPATGSDEVSRAMVGLRSFVREKKRLALRAETVSAGALL